MSPALRRLLLRAAHGVAAEDHAVRVQEVGTLAELRGRALADLQLMRGQRDRLLSLNASLGEDLADAGDALRALASTVERAQREPAQVDDALAAARDVLAKVDWPERPGTAPTPDAVERARALGVPGWEGSD